MLLLAVLLLVRAGRQRKMIVPELSAWHARVASWFARSERARPNANVVASSRCCVKKLHMPRHRWRVASGSGRGGGRGSARCVVWAIGVLSLTAGASFSGSGAVPQGALQSAHMLLTTPGAGPDQPAHARGIEHCSGDLMQRAIDVTVDGSTTAGTMTGMTLQVTAPTTTSNLERERLVRIAVVGAVVLHRVDRDRIHAGLQVRVPRWPDVAPGARHKPPDAPPIR